MQSMLYIGMAIILMSFIGLVAIGCMVGLLMSVASNGSGRTWAVFKERLPTFLALTGFLVTVGLFVYAAVFTMQHYGG